MSSSAPRSASPTARASKDAESDVTPFARDAYKLAGINLNQGTGFGSRLQKAAFHMVRGDMPTEAIMLAAQSGSNVPDPAPFGNRVVQGLEYALFGDPRAFFPPGKGLTPLAPPSAAPRQLDYPYYYNMQIMPRAYESISFQLLRDWSDGYDLARACLEHAKNKIVSQDFDIVPVDENLRGKAKANPKAIPDEMRSRIDEVRTFYTKPDNEHTFAQWLNMLTEDVLAIDAPCLFLQKTMGGKPHSFVVVDGATICRKIDYHGRTPEPPETAYQQVIKGLPALDYRKGELYYFPKNCRSNRVYGFSPIEQSLVTINLAVRRQFSQLAYYTDGARGENVLLAPESWMPEQIKTFQSYWNELMSGNLRERQKMRVIPGGGGGMKPYTPPASHLKDEMDEWLARVLCFFFGLSPMPLVKTARGASKQSEQEAADREGAMPLLNHFKQSFDELIRIAWGYRDIEFVWQRQRHTDPLQEAQMYHLYVQDNILKINEIRSELGKEPLEQSEIDAINARKQPNPGGRPMASPGNPNPEPRDLSRRHLNDIPAFGKAAGNGNGTTQKKRPVMIARTDPLFEAQATVLKNRLRRAFALKAETLARSVVGTADARPTKNHRQDKAALLLAQANAKAHFDHWMTQDWREQYEPIAQVLRLAASETVNHFEPGYQDSERLHEMAVGIANKRAAAIVALPHHGHEDNPTPEWAISDDVRDDAHKTIDQAVAENWDYKRLLTALLAGAVFGESRAGTISSTELARVIGDVAHAVAVDSGMKWKACETAGDSLVCEICLGDEDAGWIPIDEPFPSGVMSSLRHVSCRCDNIYSVENPDAAEKSAVSHARN